MQCKQRRGPLGVLFFAATSLFVGTVLHYSRHDFCTLCMPCVRSRSRSPISGPAWFSIKMTKMKRMKAVATVAVVPAEKSGAKLTRRTEAGARCVIPFCTSCGTRQATATRHMRLHARDRVVSDDPCSNFAHRLLKRHVYCGASTMYVFQNCRTLVEPSSLSRRAGKESMERRDFKPQSCSRRMAHRGYHLPVTFGRWALRCTRWWSAVCPSSDHREMTIYRLYTELY